MTRLSYLTVAAAFFGGVVACASAQSTTAPLAQAAIPSAGAPAFSAAQAARGEALYQTNCVACHGENLDDGQFAAALKGPAFTDKWGGKGLNGLFKIMTTQMPPTDPGSLGAQAYADILAFVMSKNGAAPGAADLPADGEVLKGMMAPGG